MALEVLWVQGFGVSGFGFKLLGLKVSGLGFKILGLRTACPC